MLNNSIGDPVIVAQTCEYTKNDWHVHLKVVDFMAYEFYLNFKKAATSGIHLGHTTSSLAWITALAPPTGTLAFPATSI